MQPAALGVARQGVVWTIYLILRARGPKNVAKNVWIRLWPVKLNGEGRRVKTQRHITLCSHTLGGAISRAELRCF
jgi:hypothetical protein